MHTCVNCKYGHRQADKKPCKACLSYKAEAGFEGEIFPNWKPEKKKND